MEGQEAETFKMDNSSCLSKRSTMVNNQNLETKTGYDAENREELEQYEGSIIAKGHERGHG